MARVPLIFALLVACGGNEASKPAPAGTPDEATAPPRAAASANAPTPPAPEPPPPDDGPGIGLGDVAPTFSLPDDSGKELRLDQYRDQRAVLLAFYPKDFTGGWTAELSQFRDEAEFFEQAGVQILGVSTDTVESHAKFRAELGLPFPLLADTQGELSAMYDALSEGGSSLRKIVLIDRAGRVAYRDEKLGVGEEADWQAMRDAVTALAAAPTEP